MSTRKMADDAFMRAAIAIAQSNQAAPIGCVIVRDNEILAEAHNEVDTSKDPTCHAEMVAIRRVCAALGAESLEGATLYSTLQPCGMCSLACIWSKIGRIVYGAERHQVHSMYFEDRHFDTMDFVRDAFRDDLAITGGLLSQDCASLYYAPNDDVPPGKQANR